MKDSFDDSLNGIQLSSPFEIDLDYDNYLNIKRLNANKRILFDYDGCKVGLTQKQIKVLKLVARGFSNAKIAKYLGVKEASIKLLLYRLIKSMEEEIYESIDRFYLIVIAQQLGLDEY